MTQRLPDTAGDGWGWRIDRSRPLSFTFNGKSMQGFVGDTIASALLANKVRVVGHSFKYHRPRGVYSAGVEETAAVFSVVVGDVETPNVRATTTPLTEGMQVRSQGGSPIAEFIAATALSLISRLLPAGFYYKTFKLPTRLWMLCEKYIRRAAAAAPPPSAADVDAYAHRHAYCDVLVVGGGPTGLAAATAAADTGACVIIADMAAEWGGRLPDEGGGNIDGKSTGQWLADSVRALTDAKHVTLLPNTTIQAYHDYNYVVGVENRTIAATSAARQKLWKIRAKQVIIATGAIERPLVFVGNDCPGVMLAASVQTYLRRYGVLAGRNILFFTNNDSAYPPAFAAAAAGARVEIADLRNVNNNDYWQIQAEKQKITVYSETGIVSATYTGGFISTQLGKIQHGAATETPTVFAGHAYDVIAVSAGWTPTVHLYSQARGCLRWNSRQGAFLPDAAHEINPCQAAGGANGADDLSRCLREGFTVGSDAAKRCGFNVAADLQPPQTDSPPLEREPLHLPLIPTMHPVGRGPGKHFVDLANDVTAADIELSVREGYESVEHMKRYTAAGFGAEQGKTSNVNALVLLAKARGVPPDKVGHTTYRPNYTPMRYGVVTGGDRYDQFMQRRTTPIEPWHNIRGAEYEDVGDWKRPRYFPLGGEKMDNAVWRECKAVRNHIGVMDASTLGKIDIQGPDAAEFLDRIYTNSFSTLKIGRCRYGLMLRETGMIFDDGVTARLGENHFHMTTSTGNAATVMNWLEEWLQTEWPELRVYCTSVTEQWAVIAVAGPKAHALMAEISDLPTDDFSFMSFKDGTIAGVAARVFRISFSGESSFEINVSARYGLAVWERVMKVGEKYGVTPYGTEAMHVLRAEKGFIIVGQDSDGTRTPQDMGLSWMVSAKKKDFLGCRSLSRPDMTATGRAQLVGLLPEDPAVVIPEGAHLLNNADDAPPIRAEGYVTSSYMSPTLERSFALAMLNDGISRHGETVHAVFMDNQRIRATVTETVFWDKEGERLRV